MNKLFVSKTLVVLEFSRQEILAVQIRLSSTGPIIEKTVSRPLPAHWEDDFQVRVGFLKMFWLEEEFKCKNIAWIIPRSKTIIREIELPPLSEAETLAAVKLAAEEQFSIPVEEMHLAFYRKREQPGTVEVWGIPLEIWKGMTDAFQEAGLRLVSAPVSTWAAGQTMIYSILDEYENQEDMLFIQAGFSGIEISAWQKGEMYFHRGLAEGDWQEKMSLTLEGFLNKFSNNIGTIYMIGRFPDEEWLYNLLTQGLRLNMRSQQNRALKLKMAKMLERKSTEESIKKVKTFSTVSFIATADKTDAGLLAAPIGAALVRFGLMDKRVDFYTAPPLIEMNLNTPHLAAGIAAAGLIIWLGLNTSSYYIKKDLVQKMQAERQLFTEKLTDVETKSIDISNEINSLKNVIENRVSLIPVWAELERTLPNGTRITKWTVREGELRELTGLCESVRELLSKLSKSKYLFDVKLLTPITREQDEMTGEWREKFSLTAKIKRINSR